MILTGVDCTAYPGIDFANHSLSIIDYRLARSMAYLSGMKSNLLSSSATQYLRSLCLLPLVLGVFCLTGCQHNSEVAVDPVGDYRLLSVDAKPVPCEVEHGGHSVSIRSGNFTISPDGTCKSKILFAAGIGPEASREVKATYKQEGSNLMMQWENGGRTRGTVQGDTFTMNNEGMVFAYQR